MVNYKYYLRGSDNFKDRYLRMMRKAGIDNYNGEIDGFRKTLELLSKRESVNKICLKKLYDLLNCERV